MDNIRVLLLSRLLSLLWLQVAFATGLRKGDETETFSVQYQESRAVLVSRYNVFPAITRHKAYGRMRADTGGMAGEGEPKNEVEDGDH